MHNIKWRAFYNWIHTDKDGNVLFQSCTENTLADEGKGNLLDIYMRGNTQNATYYIALFNDKPTVSDTLSSLTGEANSGGYARQALVANSATWSAPSVTSAGTVMSKSLTATFAASGGTIGPFTHGVLTNVETGVSGSLIAFDPIGGTITLNDGDYMFVSATVYLLT